MPAKNNTPTFSVVMPTFNREDLLGRAIQSVLSQTEQDFELLIVDDCSVDATAEVIRQFHDARIVPLPHKKNQGVSAARNTAITAARGQLLSFLDDDDELTPQFLERTRQHFEQHGESIDFCWTGVRRIVSCGGLEERVVEMVWSDDATSGIVEPVFLTRTAMSQGVTFRRACFDAAGLFDVNLARGEDLDIMIRMVDAGMRYAAIPEMLIHAYVHEGVSLTRTNGSDTELVSLEYLRAKHDDFLRRHPFLDKQLARSVVRACHTAGQRAKAWTAGWRLLKNYPSELSIVGKLIEAEVRVYRRKLRSAA